ncbi:hypothetical protein R6Q59_023565 [Mikania micrantha]
MGGGMEANKNKFIEDWGTVRENLEHNFRWTRRNLALVGIFGVAVPYLIYKGTVREFILKVSSLLYSIDVPRKLRTKNKNTENCGKPSTTL